MIRVITVQEPWASLIGEKVKIIETRSWPCKQYGKLYIHAGLNKISKANTKAMEASALLKGKLHYGSIFAKCTLSDCVLITEDFAQKIKESDPQCFMCGNFTPGRYAWILTNIEPVEPIFAKGKLGIWYYNND